MDLQNLIAALKAASNGATVNVTINVTGEPAVETPAMPDTDSRSSSYLPDTDFAVGDEVVICHQKKDGTGTKHVAGEVMEILQRDDIGCYTRVLGDNGKHYRIGLHYDEERLGSKAIVMD